MTYEEAIKKLTDIVDRLSSETVPLAEASGLFEEGMKLIKFCYGLVKETKGKVMEIKQELSQLKMEECNENE